MVNAIKNFYSWWIEICDRNSDYTIGFCLAHTGIILSLGGLYLLTTYFGMYVMLFFATAVYGPLLLTIAVYGPLFLAIYLKFKEN